MLGIRTDGTIIWLWDVKSGKLIREFNEHIYPIRSFALSCDGKRMISRDVATIKVWNIELGTSIETVNGRQNDVLYNEIIDSEGASSSNHISNERYQASICYSFQSC